MIHADGQGAEALKPFLVGGLASRGGLSNWVLFFYPAEIVLIDVGAGPAVWAGARIGIVAQFGLPGYAAFGRPVYGPQIPKGMTLDDFRAALQAKAKDVRVMSDKDLRGVRLHLKATAHELYVSGADGSERKFGLMNRSEADAVADSLSRLLGSRFQTSSTPTFAFFKRHAPILMK